MATAEFPELMSSCKFATKKHVEMQAILGAMKKTKRYGKIRCTGKKIELVNQFRQVRGEPPITHNVAFATPTAAPTTTTSAPGTNAANPRSSSAQTVDPKRLRKAQLAMSLHMAPKNTGISNGTHEAIRQLGMTKSFKIKDASTDISKELEQVCDFASRLQDILGNITPGPRHSDNFDRLHQAMNQTFFTISITSSVYDSFFAKMSLLSIENDQEPEIDQNDGELTKAITQELYVLQLAIKFCLRRWIETFPAPDIADAVWPLDHTENERTLFRNWIELFLNADEDDEQSEKRWGHVTGHDELEELVEDLKKMNDFPLEDDKDRTSEIIHWVIQEVKGERERSRSRSKARSLSVAQEPIEADDSNDDDESADGSEKDDDVPERGLKRAHRVEDTDGAPKRSR